MHTTFTNEKYIAFTISFLPFLKMHFFIYIKEIHEFIKSKKPFVFRIMSLAPCPSPSQRSISPSYSRKTQEELDTQFLHDRIQQYYLQVGRQNCFCGILSHLTTFSQYKSLD